MSKEKLSTIDIKVNSIFKKAKNLLADLVTYIKQCTDGTNKCLCYNGTNYDMGEANTEDDCFSAGTIVTFFDNVRTIFTQGRSAEENSKFWIIKQIV